MYEFFENLISNLFYIFYSLPLLIQVIWVIIIIEFILIISSFIYLNIIRNKYQQDYKKHKVYIEKYQELLINYIYLTEEETGERVKIESQLKSGIKNSFERDVIQKLILRLHAELSGELAVLLEKLYCDLDLVKYSLKKMSRSIWFIRIKGIREVTQMKIKDVYEETLKLNNHKNKLLRNEAQLTMVKLYQFDGLKFLDSLEYPLTEWQQIQLIEEVQTIRNKEVPDLTNWLQSENETVITFTLKIVKLYQQIQTKDLLIKLVLHPSEQARKVAINVLGYFKIVEAKTILKQIFKKSSSETQLYIIQALAEIADKKDIPFFELQLKHPDFEIHQSAYTVLKNLKPYILTVSVNK